MANDSTNAGVSSPVEDATPHNENYFTDMQGEDAFFGPEQLAQAATTEKVTVPEGQNVIRVQVNPGEIIELSSPFDPGATLLAREGDGNLAIRVGEVTVILQGYVDANQQAPVVVHTSDGQPIDIATLLASTDPTIDIQTAAGPGDAAGQGQGADNTGAILSQLANGNGLGGLTAVGAQDGTSLTYSTIDNSIRLDREDALFTTLGATPFKGLAESFLRDPYNNDTFYDFVSFFSNYHSAVGGTGNAWADFAGTQANGDDFESYLAQTSFTNVVSHSSSNHEPIYIDISALQAALAGQTSNQHALYVDMSTVSYDGTATTVFVRREGDDALIMVIHAHAATGDLSDDTTYSTGNFQIDTYLINRLDHPHQGQDVLNLEIPFKVQVFTGEGQDPTFTHGSVGVPVQDDIPVVHETDYYNFLHATSYSDALSCLSGFLGGDLSNFIKVTHDAGHVDEDYIFGGNRDKDNANGPDSDDKRGDSIGDQFVVGMLNIDFGADGPAGQIPQGGDCYDESDAGDQCAVALAIAGLEVGSVFTQAKSQGHELIVLTHEKLPYPLNGIEVVQVGYKLGDDTPSPAFALTSEKGGCEVVVFTLVLQTDPNLPFFGAFVFQQSEPLDHDIGAKLETDLPLNFSIIATDDDGDHPVDPVNIKIMVNDDAPYFKVTYQNEDPQNCDVRDGDARLSSFGGVDHFTSKDYGYVDEDWLSSSVAAKTVIFSGAQGNHDRDAFYQDNANLFGDDKGGVEVCGQIKVKYGADGPGDSDGNGNLALGTYESTEAEPYPAFVNGDPNHPALTSGGLPLVVLCSTDSKLVVGTVVADGECTRETPVFCLELDPCTGKFEFHLLAPLDHDPNTVDPENDLMLTFNVGFAEDYDGDKALGAINIKVNDDHPQADITYCNEVPGIGGGYIQHDTDFGRVDEDWLTDSSCLPNGGFENPIAVSPFESPLGPDGITGWTIGGAGVDLINGYWQGANGSTQSVDLNREGAGSIATTISGLTPGREYTVTFYLGANPELDNGPKPITVNIAGVDYPFVADSTGHTLPDVNFQKQSFTFIATGETETLTFTSGAAGPCGPVLDQVEVHATGIGNQDLDANGNSNANQYGDDYGSTHVSGQIKMSYGADGPGTQSLGLAHITEAKDTCGNVLSSQGHALTVLTSTDCKIELGYDGVVVICLTLNTSTGHFDFNQYLPLDHLIASPIEDNLYLSFKAGSITDGDGDTTDAVIKIQVNDDVPETAVTYHNEDTGPKPTFALTGVDSGASYGQVDEDFLRKGNHDQDNCLPGAPTDYERGDEAGGTCVTGCIGGDTKYGADGPDGDPGGCYALTELKVDDAFVDAEGNQLKSHDNLLVVLTSDGTTLEVGYHDPEGGDCDTVVFTLTMTSDHDFKFELKKPLDDPQGKCDPIEQGIVLAFGAGDKDAPTDRDQDPAVRIVIHVNDDAPKFCEVNYCPGWNAGLVDEDYLHGGNHDTDNRPYGPSDYDRGDTIGGNKLTGQVVVEFGADGPGKQPFSFDCYKAGDCFTDACGNTFSSHGHELTVLDATADHLVVGYSDWQGNSTTVFTLTIDDCGNFCFDLEKPLDHPVDCKPEDGLKMVFDVTASDFDGDTVDARINVKINDDAPKACDVVYHNQDTGDYEEVTLTSATSGGGHDSDKIGKVDEDWLRNGNEDQDNCPPGAPSDWKQGDKNGGTCVTGCLDIRFGADGPAGDCGQQALGLKGVPEVGCAYPNMSSPLTSGGHTLVVLEHCTDSNGVETLVVGYKDEGHGSPSLTSSSFGGGGGDCDVVIFTLTLHTDPSDCDFQEFKFELKGPLDQAVDCTPETSLLLCFSVEASDYDGDTVCTDIKVQVNDDAPMVLDAHYQNQHPGGETEQQLQAASFGGGDSCDTIGKVDEDWLPNGNHDKEAHPDAVANGSFEDPVVIGDFSTLAGPDGITGWTVTGSGVDLIHDYWNASEGDQSVDVNAAGPGTLSTVLTGLVIGQTYTISFDLSGNPEIEQGVKQLQVTVGDYDNTFEVDTTGKSLADGLCWETQTFTFVAQHENETLTFASLSSGPCGPVLDNVTICGTPVKGDDDGGTCVTGCLNVVYGADGPADGHLDIKVPNGSQALHLSNVPETGCAYPNMSNPLTSGGHTLVVLDHCTDCNGVETLVVGYKDEGHGGSAPFTVTGGSDCDVVIFTLTLHTDPCDCDFQEFKFELKGPLDQDPTCSPESSMLLCFGVEATDNDGDAVCTDIKVQVNDDSPLLGEIGYHNQNPGEVEAALLTISGGDGDTIGKVDEDWLKSGNQDKDGADGDDTGGTCVTGCLNISYGGDGPAENYLTKVENGSPALHLKDVPEVGCAYPNMSCPLTSGGQPLVVLEHCTDSDGVEKLVVGYQNAIPSLVSTGGDNVPIFTLTLHTDPCDPCFQDFKFELQGPLDQEVAETLESNLLLAFGVVATDNDGDSVCTEIKIQVNDDAPLAVDDAQSFYYWREDLSGNVLANDKKGADGATVTHLLTAAGAVDVIGTSAAEIAGLHGTFFVYADGSYTYAPDNYNNNHEPGNDSLTYTVKDGDGDVSTATLTITYTPATHTPTPGAYDKNISTDGDYNAEVDNPAAYSAGKTFHIVDNGDGHEIRGGKGDDWIVAHGGGDNLFGRGGNDILEGNAGKDNLHGGNGDDTLFGGNNDDDLTGGAGHDAMSGGAGDDVFHDVDADDLDGVNTLDGIHSIDGGMGEDTVELGGLTTFGLDEAKHVMNVEHLDLGANSNGDNVGTTVTLDYGAVYGITQVGGLHVLTITGDAAGDSVSLVNDATHTWNSDGNDGSFDVYSSGSGADQVVVKVQQDVASAVVV